MAGSDSYREAVPWALVDRAADGTSARVVAVTAPELELSDAVVEYGHDVVTLTVFAAVPPELASEVTAITTAAGAKCAAIKFAEPLGARHVIDGSAALPDPLPSAARHALRSYIADADPSFECAELEQVQHVRR